MENTTGHMELVAHRTALFLGCAVSFALSSIHKSHCNQELLLEAQRIKQPPSTNITSLNSQHHVKGTTTGPRCRNSVPTDL